MTSTTAVVLLGHGSPDPRAAAGLRSLARAVTRARPGSRIEVAFLDHDDPGLTDLVTGLAADDVDAVVVVPAFLSTAHHVRADVPRAVTHAMSASAVPIRVTAPIGPDPSLLGLLDNQVAPTGAVVLASAGTRDPDAREELEGLASEWSRRRGTAVVLGFAAMAEPDVATAVARAATVGTPVSVASYVLFPGVLADRIHAAAGSAPVTSPLGDSVVDVVLARVDALS